MKVRVYYSNLSAAWPFSRQEMLFAEKVPGWPKGVDLYRDAPSGASRKVHKVDKLVERHMLLRPTSRATMNETLYVASLLCLAFHEADLTDVLEALSVRRTKLVALDINLEIPQNPTISEVNGAVKLFREGKRTAKAGPGSGVGAKISAERRAASAKDRADKIAARWVLPSKDYPTSDLLKEAKLSRATVNKYLENRPDAQRKHERAEATKARNSARRKPRS